MGSCLSTTKTKPKPKPKSHRPNPIAGAPPPPPPPPQLVEEEAVKEVLSETPIIPKPYTIYKNHLHPEIQSTAAIRPNNNHHHHHQPPNHLHPVPEQPRVQPTATIKANNSSYHQLHPVPEQQRIQPTAAIKPNNNSSYHQPSNLLQPVAEQPRIQPTAAIKPNNDSSYRQPSNHLHPVAEQPTAAAVKPTDEIVSEVSDLSELYSYSESLSTVTENFIENNDGEVNQQRVYHRSPVKNATRRKRPVPVGTNRTPARRSEPSPAKRGQGSQGRNMTPARRNAGLSSVIRRDAGEGSGRRSRSPAKLGEGGGRRPARSSGGQERRSRRDAGDGVSGAVVPETMPAAEEKSLDDPNVSLECFIFL